MQMEGKLVTVSLWNSMSPITLLVQGIKGIGHKCIYALIWHTQDPAAVFQGSSRCRHNPAEAPNP